MKNKNLDILKLHANQHGLDWAILHAILICESNADGYWDNGQIKTRFEPHIFAGFKNVKEGRLNKHPALPGLSKNWIKEHSKQELQMLSISYGIAQIMGWHYPMLNYKSIQEMVEAWQELEEIQIRDFCLFTVKYRNGTFIKALRNLDYESIAYMYNGSGYKKNDYDFKLKQAYLKHKDMNYL